MVALLATVLAALGRDDGLLVAPSGVAGRGEIAGTALSQLISIATARSAHQRMPRRELVPRGDLGVLRLRVADAADQDGQERESELRMALEDAAEVPALDTESRRGLDGARAR